IRLFFILFFSSRRRHTRFSRDWSSDVCSSDLNKAAQGLALNYLALEDTRNFYVNKQLTNSTSTEVENDRNLAVNSVYNFINNNRSEERRVGKESRSGRKSQK